MGHVMNLMLAVILATLLSLSSVVHAGGTNPKHIVFIVADDLGWNDIGFNNPDIISPNLDKLAAQGVILNNSYVQPVCSPSRHSFMTGVYPFKAGLQHGVLMAAQQVCSPFNMPFLPEKLKTLGYSTNMFGKWHLGFCNWNCTPTHRGFDTFFGFYVGKEDYYNKTIHGGYDFRLQDAPFHNLEYSSELYAAKAEEIIQTHDNDTPLFLYAAFQSVHNPIQVPQKYEDMYPNIKTQGRRQYCGMVTALDDAVGRIVNALERKGIMNDTLIIFTTDNGGWPQYFGNNYPLRGSKVTIFEGGTRGVAFVHGAGLEKTGYRYTGLMHAVDWHPTILAAAGGSVVTDGIDGISMWEAISKNLTSNRTEIVYNIDNDIQAPTGHAAIRVGDYKLIDGFPGPYPDWYRPDEVTESATAYQSDCQDSHDYKDIAKKAFKINGYTGEGLYNLKDDPTEHHDISKDNPEIVKMLKARLDEHRKQYVEPNFPPVDPAANPSNYGGYWSPGWC